MSKMNKKYALIMITLLLGSSTSGLGLVGVQAVDDPQQLADTMMITLQTSHDEVTELFDSNEGTIPENAQESYDEAVELKTQAENEYALSNYEEAIELAVDTINEYGKAAEKLLEEAEAQGSGEPEDVEVEQHLGLYVAQEQSFKRLEKRREIEQSLAGQGINVESATGLLDEAQAKLNEMSTALEVGDYETAAQLLGEANSRIGQSTGELQKASHPQKKAQTEQFIAETTHLVENLEAKILRTLENSDLSDEEKQEILDLFNQLMVKLDSLDLENEDLEDIIDELNEIIKDTRNVGKGKGEAFGKTFESLNQLNKHEALIDKYWMKTNSLKERGADPAKVEEIESLLFDAEEALAIILTSAGEGEVEGLIDELDDLLEEIDDLLDDLEEETVEEEHGKAGGEHGLGVIDLRDDLWEMILELRAKLLEVEEDDREAFEVELADLEARFESAVSKIDLDVVEEDLEDLEDRIEDLIEGQEPDETG
jgi:tetratricopeptide (TPR) repeat protein